MNSFSVENQGINTYLTYQIEPECEIDTLSLGMITNNKIEGISPILFSQLDDEKYLKYNITAKVSAKEFLSGAVTKKRLVGVFSSILSAIMSAEEYMINLNSLLFDLEYIFVDVSTCKAEMVCLPIFKEGETPVDIGLFFKNIMFSTQFDPTESSDHIAKIMNYLNSSTTLDFANFKLMIDNLILEENAVKPQAYVQTIVRQQPEVSKKVEQQVVPTEKPVQPAKQINNHVVLTPDMQPQPQAQQVQSTDNINAPQQTDVSEDGNEKSMSWLYLMQHYNKENAAIYKSQKTNKKEKTEKTEKKEKVSKNEKKTSGFTIPGTSIAQPSRAKTPGSNIRTHNSGFAIPGQAAPSISVPTKMQMNIPNSTSQSAAVPNQGMNQQMNIPGTQPQMGGRAPQPTYTPDPLGQANANFGETVVLNTAMAGTGETTVLGASAEPMEIIPYLMRAKNNEKILLNKPVFRLGKEKSYVDYFIGDNTAISRSHANVITKDGEYFVVDTNSTNHTYVNGVILQSNVETKISHGDKIRLANEDFTFNLY